MQTTSGPHRSVIVNDQTQQPAQVWTHDGLYVGGFFDHRANDNFDDGLYRVHGDDNQRDGRHHRIRNDLLADALSGAQPAV